MGALMTFGAGYLAGLATLPGLAIMIAAMVIVRELRTARRKPKPDPKPDPPADRAREVVVCDRDGEMTSRVTALQPAEVSEMLLTALEAEGHMRRQAEREGWRA